MAKLGLYLAKEYDGILFDPQTGTYGSPNVRKIVASASRFFEEVNMLLELSGGEVLDEYRSFERNTPE